MNIPDPMGVSRFCVDPKRLRSFFRDVPNGPFSTVYAMERMEVSEPDASKLLLALAEAQWIQYLGEKDGIDRWKLAQLGSNFMLKDFLPRTSVAKAEQLLEKAINAARDFNKLDVSTRISEIKLFGSLARGGDEAGTVGDIDLDIVIADRLDIPENDRDALLQKEAANAPSHLQDGWMVEGWARLAGIRHLRKVGKRLTASNAGNVDHLRCEHRVVYRFDVEKGEELPCDRQLIPADEARQREIHAAVAHEAPLPVLPEFRPWPEPPQTSRSNIDPLSIYIDIETAQYFWQRGWSLDRIAERGRATAVQIQAALSSLSLTTKSLDELVYAASPMDAIAPFAAVDPDVHVNVRMGLFATGEVNVHLRKDSLHTICSASTTKLKTSGSPELYPLAESIARASALWFKRFRSKMPKVQPFLDFDLTDGFMPLSLEPSTMKAATAFGKAINRHFDDLFQALPFTKSAYSDSLSREAFLEVDFLEETVELRDAPGSRTDGLAQVDALHGVANELENDLWGSVSCSVGQMSFSRRDHQYESDALA